MSGNNSSYMLRLPHAGTQVICYTWAVWFPRLFFEEYSRRSINVICHALGQNWCGPFGNEKNWVLDDSDEGDCMVHARFINTIRSGVSGQIHLSWTICSKSIGRPRLFDNLSAECIGRPGPVCPRNCRVQWNRRRVWAGPFTRKFIEQIGQGLFTRHANESKWQ